MNTESFPDAIVRARALALHFDDGETQALDGVDIAIRAGEFVAVVGPSGCGKSSLLNIIGTLEAPTTGEVFFRAQPYGGIRDPSLFRRQHIGFIFQSFNLIPTLNALDNVVVATIGVPGAGSDQVARARELLEKLGLRDRMAHFPNKMSGGERQRVAIARALINTPDLILADEPTGSLDSANSAAVLTLLTDIQKERGLTLIMATHDPSVSARADRIIHMRDGKIALPQDPAP
ncbi:ABC transporter ATP-binding protein [uncultured Thiodictyon sp.]|uniref:ABC transporter ATP-binding protein n=1 Tax=uncultured Thiodictyon sp. TaxID=1846217 RepID=UPI0025DF0DDA|nr:ABC transporter ATP-binding protein [uncultured Thiodictyon sp.]